MPERDTSTALVAHDSRFHVDIEPRLRRLVGYRHLPKLQAAIMKELKLGNAGESTSGQHEVVETALSFN
jgi:hypothetical protein